MHLYCGSERNKEGHGRAHATYTIAWWADKREKRPYAFTRDIIVLGDFNMSKAAPTDPVFKALWDPKAKLGGHVCCSVSDHRPQWAEFRCP